MEKQNTYQKYFGKDLKLFFFALAILGIFGSLIDILLNKKHEEPIVQLNIIVISILAVATVIYSTKLISVYIALFIAIYSLLANMALSLFLTQYNHNFEMWFFRESLFWALLLTIASLTLGKKHGYTIGFFYLVFYLMLILYNKNQILISNLPITLVVFSSFAVVTTYFVQKLQTTIMVLQQKNELIERQSKSLEESYIEIEETQAQLEENMSELQSMTSTIEENNELLEQQNLQLQESNITKDKFFSIIAHDLKGPMSANTSLLELMLKNFDISSDEKKKEQLNIMAKGAHNLYQLLENLLIWSRSQTHSLPFSQSEIYLFSVIKKCTATLQTQAKIKNITIESNVSEFFAIFADKMMVETVFRNILSNALKFTKHEGKVEIEAQLVNDFVEVKISDNGIGMSVEKLKKLFKLTEKVTSPGTDGERGTGLGLILCKEFVEQNGGSIDVKSKLGAGTTFTIRFPQKKQISNQLSVK